MTDRSEAVALAVAALENDDGASLREMLAREPRVAAMPIDGLSLVMRARYRGARDALAALLEVKPPLSVFDAAALGEVEALRANLHRDAEATRASSVDGFTALHLAAYCGSLASARVLLDAGADPRAVANNAMRVQPLHSAVSGRHAELVELLLERGASVDASQGGGLTPLHAAAHNGDLASLRLLLAHGADTTIADDRGKQAADYAAEAPADVRDSVQALLRGE